MDYRPFRRTLFIVNRTLYRYGFFRYQQYYKYHLYP